MSLRYLELPWDLFTALTRHRNNSQPYFPNLTHLTVSCSEEDNYDIPPVFQNGPRPENFFNRSTLAGVTSVIVPLPSEQKAKRIAEAFEDFLKAFPNAEFTRELTFANHPGEMTKYLLDPNHFTCKGTEHVLRQLSLPIHANISKADQN